MKIKNATFSFRIGHDSIHKRIRRKLPKFTILHKRFAVKITGLFLYDYNYE